MAVEDIATKQCSRCGEIKPYSEFNKDAKNTGTGLQSKCRACQKEVRHDWYMRNREREIAKAIEWAKNNPENVREKDRRRAVARPGRTATQAKKWRLENKDRYLASRRKWKRANPEKVRASARASYAKNPDKYLAKSHKRRQKDPSTGAIFTRRDVARIYKQQRGMCACCRGRLRDKFERDHILPLALGGTNDPANIQLLCKPCNQRKSAKHPVDFMQENNFLL